LVLKEEGFGDLLPGADAIIIDEAHQLPEVATQFLGFTVSARQLQALTRDLAAELLTSGPRTEVSATFAQTLERQLVDLQDSLGGRRERCEFSEWPPGVIEGLERVQAMLEELAGSLGEAAKDNAGVATLRRRSVELSARIGTMLGDHN